MPVFFTRELEGVATFWRLFRSDGIALGFTSHDRALRFDGILHRAAPGMLPSAIRLTADLSPDSLEVEGVLSHDSIRQADLEAGLYDGARIEMGAVDWESRESALLYGGWLGQISSGRDGFTAELRSNKAMLERDLVPRTSPTCRAEFCGPGCNLSAARHASRIAIEAIDLEANAVAVASIVASDYVDGRLRFLDGPQAGFEFGIVQASDAQLFLDRPLAPGTVAGTIAELRDGCDHTLETCGTRFGNAINFRGDPYLPGNDLLARYAAPK